MVGTHNMAFKTLTKIQMAPICTYVAKSWTEHFDDFRFALLMTWPPIVHTITLKALISGFSNRTSFLIDPSDRKCSFFKLQDIITYIIVNGAWKNYTNDIAK